MMRGMNQTAHHPVDASHAAPQALETSRLRQLSDLPGPRPWPLVGNALQVNLDSLHLDLERWLVEHGPTLRLHLGREAYLVVSDHRLITQLLRDRPDTFRRPSLLEEVLREMGIRKGVFLAEGTAVGAGE
jgi:hypothetical protein